MKKFILSGCLLLFTASTALAGEIIERSLALLVTPAADPLVGRWRAEHDWAAQHGIPAHVTIRLPFLPRVQWRDPSIALLLPLRVVGSEIWAAEGSAEDGVVHAVVATTHKT